MTLSGVTWSSDIFMFMSVAISIKCFLNSHRHYVAMPRVTHHEIMTRWVLERFSIVVAKTLRDEPIGLILRYRFGIITIETVKEGCLVRAVQENDTLVSVNGFTRKEDIRRAIKEGLSLRLVIERPIAWLDATTTPRVTHFFIGDSDDGSDVANGIHDHDSEAVDESEDEPNVDDNDWEVVDDESEDEPTSVTWDIIEWQ
jgi:hypothetical protein